MTSSHHHNDNNAPHEVALNFITSSALNLITQAQAHDEGSDFQRGVLTGLVTGSINLLSMQLALSEEDTVALFNHVIKRLAQREMLRPLLTWGSYD